MHPRSLPRGRSVPVVLLTLAVSLALALSLAAACTAPAPAPSPPAPAPTAAATAEPAPTAAQPAPTTAPLAEDEPAACAQGSCEIRVAGPATIPLPAGTGVTEIRVVAVDAGRVELVAAVPGGQVSTRCSGSCAGMRTSSSNGTGSVRVTAGAGAVVGVNDVRIDVRSAAGGEALLRLTPR